MLRTHIEYIEQKQKEKKLPAKVEIVCVDDGSKDKTWQIILEWSKKYPECKSGVTVRGLR
jgi:glycosyltransferase involved in cell wall biosynthesis